MTKAPLGSRISLPTIPVARQSAALRGFQHCVPSTGIARAVHAPSSAPGDGVDGTIGTLQVPTESCFLGEKCLACPATLETRPSGPDYE